MAEKLKLEIEQRATFRHRLIWKGRNNKRIDLSGWTAIMQVRPSFSDDQVVSGGNTYRQTMTWTSWKLTGVSNWVKQ